MDERQKIRYAVVGQGYIAQIAVLPAFAHATRNSKLVAIVSDDPTKRDELGKKYRARTCGYDDVESCFSDCDAVYLALPNSMHADHAVRALEAGLHVLCEKPMAFTVDDCERMNAASKKSGASLMVGYRLHFEAANLHTLELVQDGAIGLPRIFDSTFTMQVKPGNVRLSGVDGGGPLWDIGIYCINAARTLFGSEPIDVLATDARGADPRFHEVPECVSAILRFPGDRIATFTCSFGASDTSQYRVIGTEGVVRLEPAYDLAEDLRVHVTQHGKTKKRTFRRRDQFAPELLYFSDCIVDARVPEPSGIEGLADVRVMEAIERSAKSRQAVTLTSATPRPMHPAPEQAHGERPVKKPELVHAQEPSR